MSISRKRWVYRVRWVPDPASVSPAVKPSGDTWLCRECCDCSAGNHYLILMLSICCSLPRERGTLSTQHCHVLGVESCSLSLALAVMTIPKSSNLSHLQTGDIKPRLASAQPGGAFPHRSIPLGAEPALTQLFTWEQEG